MELFSYLKNRHCWPIVVGYLMFIAMMAGGYYYIIAFIQFIIMDLAARIIGLSRNDSAALMANLTVTTSIFSVGFGSIMQRYGWGLHFIGKLRIVFIVSAFQAILMTIAPFIKTESDFYTWIIASCLTLGVGIPALFSMGIDLIPTRDRGSVAAIITALAYLGTVMLFVHSRNADIAMRVLPILLVGTVVLGFLSFRDTAFIRILSLQHMRPEFGHGRFVHIDDREHVRVSSKLFGFMILLYGIYIIESFAFLSLACKTVYVADVWTSLSLSTRMSIGAAFVVAAVIAGALYARLSRRALFLSLFGLFAFINALYIYNDHLRFGTNKELIPLMLFAATTSIYTVISLAIWPDMSTPDTISVYSGIGVALSGWTATFLSTSLALEINVSETTFISNPSFIIFSIIILLILAVILGAIPKRSPGD